VYLLKDVPVKIGAESLAYTVSIIKGLKEEFFKIADHKTKDVMAGLGSVNGQV
jgi:hypothetical protein